MAVLAINDHLLKGSGHSLETITGKLSDFAGLLVAPLLLAALAGLRSKKAWVAAHVAVGLVFAGIQVSAPFAALWSAAMGWVGFPWTITMDTTDLVALPMLLVSWHVLGRAQVQTAGGNARRTAEVSVATAGLFACVATSYDEPYEPEEPPPVAGTDDGFDDDDDFGDDDGPGQLPDFVADAYLHNATAEDQVVRIRALKPDVEIDCEIMAEAPGTLLTSPLFDLAETWTLPAGTNQPVGGYTEDRNCRAALVEVDNLPPRLLFWPLGEPEQYTVPGQGSQPGREGELRIMPQPEGLSWGGAESLSYDLTIAEPECQPQPDGERLAWSEPAPWGAWTVTAVEPGYDGCFEFELSNAAEDTESWFICVPAETMVIEAGDEVEIDPATIGDGFTMIATDETGERGIVAVAWDQAPQLFGFELAVVPDFDCSAEVQPACGTVASPVHVSVATDTGAAQLLPGAEASTLSFDDEDYRFALIHGQERNAVDPGCGLGPDGIGYDLELVVGITPTPAE
ncbi:MAG: hypothetical protein AAF721_01650 [Myxococcota bacterium]